MLGPQGKWLISWVKSSLIGPGSCLTHVIAEANTRPNNSETLPNNSENNSLGFNLSITHHRSALDRLLTPTAQFAHGCGVA